MDTEFHYSVTGLIARAAGFTETEAKLIATACEFVDENDVVLKVKDRSKGGIYTNYISQTMNILKPKQTLMRIYPVFHFVPGDPLDPRALRRDGKMHLLNTTPGNEFANELIDEAFKAPEALRNYRIGIATHTYTDTWAHQNFVGWFDSFNNMGVNIKPDIGHADAEHHPDWVSHRWEDCRLVDSEVDNSERLLDASKNLYDKFTRYTETGLGRAPYLSWDGLRGKILLGSGTSFSGYFNAYQAERMACWKKEVPWLGDFDERTWIEAAMIKNIHGLEDPGDGILSAFTLFKDEFFWREDVCKEETDWYRFQESIKAHQRLAIERINPLFQKIGIDLHRN